MRSASRFEQDQRRCRRRRLATMMHEIFHFPITLRRHLQADFFRQPIGAQPSRSVVLDFPPGDLE